MDQVMPLKTEVPLQNKKGKIFGIIALVLIFMSLFQGLIALPAIVFAILSYAKGEKALGLLCIILSILFFIVIMGFGIYVKYGLTEEQLKNLGGASAITAYSIFSSNL